MLETGAGLLDGAVVPPCKNSTWRKRRQVLSHADALLQRQQLHRLPLLTRAEGQPEQRFLTRLANPYSK